MNNPTELQVMFIALGVTLVIQLILVVALVALWYELRAARLRIKLETAMFTVDTVFLRAKQQMRRAIEGVAQNMEQ